MLAFQCAGILTIASMDIEILHVPGCPNLDRARSHLDAALRAAGLAANVRETEVADAETAARVGMRGSPTILIDGRDAVPGDALAASMSCRLYAGEGTMQGAPSVDQLVEALTR